MVASGVLIWIILLRGPLVKGQQTVNELNFGFIKTMLALATGQMNFEAMPTAEVVKQEKGNSKSNSHPLNQCDGDRCLWAVSFSINRLGVQLIALKLAMTLLSICLPDSSAVSDALRYSLRD